MPNLPNVYVTPNNGEEAFPKKYPNGLAVTFAAVMQAWPYVCGKQENKYTSAKIFTNAFYNSDPNENAIDLKKMGQDLAEKYNGIKNPPIADTHEKYRKIAANEDNLDYFCLRHISEFVGLPVGLFLLFTNLVSKERRIEKDIDTKNIDRTEKKTELLKLVHKIELFALEARRQIQDAEDSDQIFYNTFEDGKYKLGQSKRAPNREDTYYLANIDSLVKLRDASKS